MIDKLPTHYSMNNPASVYDEEALTALELAGRTAQKVNECVDLMNETHEHFVENFEENVDNSVEKLKDNGSLESMLVKAVSSGKVDKGGVGQINYSMLAQDVREKFTEGAVPVVGVNAVSTANLVDGSVTEVKLSGNLKNVWFFPDSIKSMHTAIIQLSSADYTAAINPEFTSTGCKLICRDTLYALDPSTMTVDASMWTSGMASIYYDPITQVFYVANVTTTNATTKRCLYLGSMGGDASEFIIPIEYNGAFFLTGSKKLFRHLPLTAMNVEVFETFPYHQSSAFFNFDWNTGTLTFTQPTKTIYLSVATLVFKCDFSTATAEVLGHSVSNGHIAVYFNPFKNKFILTPTNETAWRPAEDCLYLGRLAKVSTVTTELDLCGKNSCILPHTINSTHYFHPNVKERPDGKLVVDNAEIGLNVVTVKIDYVGKKIIIPKDTRLFIMGNGYYCQILDESTSKYITTGRDYEIPFVEGDNQYLVGGQFGLKLVSPTEYKTAWGKHHIDGLWDLGYINVRGKESHLNCKAERCVRFSILGDSVSTFKDMIPSGNVTYYTGSNCGITSYKQTWWGRVADALGWKLCVNNSWSGSMVTDTTAKGSTVRAGYLNGDSTEETPDVIFFGMGGNDFNQGVNLGSVYSGSELDYVRSYNTNGNPDFATAYINTLYRLKKNYPYAKIYTFTFFPSLRYADRVSGGVYSNGCYNVFPPNNKNGVSVTELNHIIKSASEICGVECIDLWSAGYTFDNAHRYFGDFISDESADNFGFHQHQNAEGMKLWANKVINHVKHSQGVF